MRNSDDVTEATQLEAALDAAHRRVEELQEKLISREEETDRDFATIPPITSRCINPEHGPMSSSERSRRHRARFRRLRLSIHGADYFLFRDICNELDLSQSTVLAKMVSVVIDQHRQGMLADLLRTVKGRTVMNDSGDDESEMRESAAKRKIK